MTSPSPQEISSRSIRSGRDSASPMDINNLIEVDNEAEKVPSLGDEELGSADEAEAEEIEEDPNEAAEQIDNLEAFRKKERAKTSKAWDDFKEVDVGDDKYYECKHYKVKLKKTKTSTTTSMLRHLSPCTVKLKKLRQPQQQKINFPTANSSIPHPYLHTGKFDMAAMRESAAEWVLMHEHPFSIVEEDGFNLMLKREIPEWQKII
ncbi:Unknown protein [Striga hermonthica]|uniref:Uncharacterized protein n=1 Tax=Striga hermonthica TaxID=68872 RepID=A0A9N7P3M7_STRHE|nr:Unknown protein [Striga hermonthica]